MLRRALSLAVVAVVTAAAAPAATIVSEAEAVRLLAPPMAVVPEEGAGGGAVVLAAGAGTERAEALLLGAGFVDYRVVVPDSGTYTFWVRAFWPGPEASAVSLQVDAGPLESGRPGDEPGDPVVEDDERVVVSTDEIAVEPAEAPAEPPAEPPTEPPDPVTWMGETVTDEVYGEWHWVRGPEVELALGTHILRLVWLEGGARIDQWLLSDRGPGWAPGGVLAPTPEYLDQ